MAKRTRRGRTAPAKSRPSVTLPDDPVVPAADPSALAVWVYGPPGIGKTSFLHELVGSSALHLFFGDRNVLMPLRQRSPATWDEAIEYVRLVRESDDYDAVVADVVDNAYEMCFDWMCDGRIEDPHGVPVEHPNDANDRGKSWKKIKREFARWVDSIITANMGVGFASHARESDRETADGDRVNDVHPAIAGQGLEVLNGKCDVIGYYYKDHHGQRLLRIEGTDEVMAKVRGEDRFRWPDGSRIAEIPMGDSPAKAAENFRLAFRNELEKPSEPARRRPVKKKKGENRRRRRK